MPTERQTDFIIAELLKSAGINFFPNGSNIFEIQNALATYSKFKFQKKIIAFGCSGTDYKKILIR